MFIPDEFGVNWKGESFRAEIGAVAVPALFSTTCHFQGFCLDRAALIKSTLRVKLAARFFCVVLALPDQAMRPHLRTMSHCT
jgi:hypothetical protein